MRLRITHETAYRYDRPMTAVTQILRMTPRGHDGQFIVDWRVEVDRDCRLLADTDAFGNSVHSFALTGAIPSLIVTATGEVETEDSSGVVKGQVEPFPTAIFLRETRLTEDDREIREFAGDMTRGFADRLSRLHELNKAIFRRMNFDTGPTDASTPAKDAFSKSHGVCQDYAHIFIAAARHLDVPARYVSGYLFQEAAPQQEAGHGWVEAWIEGLGWVAFDPANGVSATDGYVRVAVGLDYLGAAPVRGSRHGGSGETLAVRVAVDNIGRGVRS